MCGIAGIALLNPSAQVDPTPLGRMLGRLEHRGPDDRGTFVHGPVALGHRRLSVIDLAGGHQPMTGARATTRVVTNGEIYNFLDLRRELEGHGHRFRTRSDTEVAARAYDQWGVDFLERLEGMFALAVWDGDNHRLVLARDRLGEKPLFYTIAGGALIFASELTSVCEHPLVSKSIDMEALSAYLALEYVPAPRSIIQGVCKLRPGTALTLEGGEQKLEHYWRLSPRPFLEPTISDAAQWLRDRLDAATRSSLVSDVPLGVFLSGGLDSSVVAALAARHGAVKTFSIGFREKSFDERPYARRVAQKIGAEHHELVLEGTEMPDLVPSIGAMLDEPLADASLVPTTLLSRFARRHVTVALGGDGGDELFGGYPMYQAHQIAFLGRRIPAGIARLLDAMAAGGRAVSHRNFSTGFKIRTFLRGARLDPPYNHVAWMSSWLPDEQESLLTDTVWESAARGCLALTSIEDAWAASEGTEIGVRARYLDTVGYLPGDILTKVDRASMSVGLEVRAPFLARPVVELAFALPQGYHMRRLTGKRLVREAFSDILPPEVLTRPKKGFGVPVGRWLNGPLREMTDDLLSASALRSAGLFRPSEVRRRLDEHRAGVRDHRKPLWTLMVFELWRRSAVLP
jgi:asparagine synthase (glutamine-hydrolysing)